jgi:hypothetical protein
MKLAQTLQIVQLLIPRARARNAFAEMDSRLKRVYANLQHANVQNPIAPLMHHAHSNLAKTVKSISIQQPIKKPTPAARINIALSM